MYIMGMFMKNNRLIQKKIKMGNEGFTLLEVIVAISILTVGLLAVGTMQVSAIYGNSIANKVTKATSIAEDKLEQLLTLQYSLTATHPDLSEGNHGPIDQPGYSMSWRVDNNTPFPNTKAITVTVSWQDRWVTRSTSLSSYLTRI
jgi:type IV pilus assembly protein PilV